jgi:hypothetical protein
MAYKKPEEFNQILEKVKEAEISSDKI